MIVVCPHCGQKNRIPAQHLPRVVRCGRCKEKIGPQKEPINVKSVSEFNELISQDKVPVLVDFWAAWCAPCRAAAPHVARTAKMMAGRALVLKVDTESLPQIAQRYGVRGIPNFAIIKGGRLIQQRAGLVDANVMMSWLKAAANA